MFLILSFCFLPLKMSLSKMVFKDIIDVITNFKTKHYSEKVIIQRASGEQLAQCYI